MEIIIIAVSLLAVIGMMGFFMFKMLDQIARRDQIIASMVREGYSPEQGVVGDMVLDTLADQDQPEEKEEDLIDTAEMTNEDLANLTEQ